VLFFYNKFQKTPPHCILHCGGGLLYLQFNFNAGDTSAGFILRITADVFQFFKVFQNRCGVGAESYSTLCLLYRLYHLPKTLVHYTPVIQQLLMVWMLTIPITFKSKGVYWTTILVWMGLPLGVLKFVLHTVTKSVFKY